MKRTRYKIAMISSERISNHKSHSGVPFYMLRALEKYLGDVTPIDGLRPERLSFSAILDHGHFCGCYSVLRFKQLFWKLLRKNYRWQHTALLSRYYARKIHEATRGEQYDFLFTDMGSTEIAYLNTNIPLIYKSDATFHLLVDYYPAFSNLAKGSIKEGNNIEQRAINKAKLCLYHSKWAAASAIKDYGAPKDKVHVTYFGPCIASSLLPGDEDNVVKQNHQKCHLLLVGVDWRRKGCPVAVETVKILALMGIDAHLTICGCKPPARFQLPENVTVVPYLDKNRAVDMERIANLYKNATYLILPTRAEALAGVFIEAFAFGVPVCSTDVGGAPEVIRDGETGFLFSRNDKADTYASRIASSLKNPAEYQRMAINAYRLYKDKLNWDRWAEHVKTLVSGHISDQ